jgi:hypothetical protein
VNWLAGSVYRGEEGGGASRSHVWFGPKPDERAVVPMTQGGSQCGFAVKAGIARGALSRASAFAALITNPVRCC